MVGFTLEYQTRDGNGLVEMCGDNVKYWRGTGLPEYEGGTEGFHGNVFAGLLPNVQRHADMFYLTH